MMVLLLLHKKQDISTDRLCRVHPAFRSSLLWKWEKVEELDFGLDFTVLNNRLSGELDCYKRTTKDAVFLKTLQLGAGSLLMNNGEIQNSGLEVSKLGRQDRT